MGVECFFNINNKSALAQLPLTGVIHAYNPQSSKYVILLDNDGSLVSLTENALDEAAWF